MGKTSRSTTRRFWRRTATPRSWWPWGIAPLVGLGLLFVFGVLLIAPRIEAEVREQVAERIELAGLSAIEVRSDGQGVAIITQAEADQELYLQTLAATTLCNTWAGPLPCSTSVDVRRIRSLEPPALPGYRRHQFTAERNETGVWLTGEVPNLEEHDRILDIAGKHFIDIANSLSISNDRAGANFSQAADHALAIASRMASGNASWTGETLNVNGSADAESVAELREQFGAIGNESLRGEFNVRPLFGSQQCNADFNQMLSNAPIRFQTGSASIEADNDELLARLAELAQSCPGQLSVAGHTDSQGDGPQNQALSLARAAAVRDALAVRGVAAYRMTATGFGESQPIADNGISSGRAKNRRIAITIDESN